VNWSSKSTLPRRTSPAARTIVGRLLGDNHAEFPYECHSPGQFAGWTGTGFEWTLIRRPPAGYCRVAPPGTRLVLFGSAARGERNEHSDLGLLVIEPTVTDPIRESARLDMTLIGMLAPTDIVVSQDSVREWRDVYGTVINAALDDDRELAA
jgi:predicted nucleotidyltransferase